jgi:hypothetical protein
MIVCILDSYILSGRYRIGAVSRPCIRCIDRTTLSSRRGYPRGIVDALQESRVGLVCFRTIVQGVGRVSCVS